MKKIYKITRKKIPFFLLVFFLEFDIYIYIFLILLFMIFDPRQSRVKQSSICINSLEFPQFLLHVLDESGTVWDVCKKPVEKTILKIGKSGLIMTG